MPKTIKLGAYTLNFPDTATEEQMTSYIHENAGRLGLDKESKGLGLGEMISQFAKTVPLRAAQTAVGIAQLPLANPFLEQVVDTKLLSQPFEEAYNWLEQAKGMPTTPGGVAGRALGEVSAFILEAAFGGAALRPVLSAKALMLGSKIAGTSKFANITRGIVTKLANEIPLFTMVEAVRDPGDAGQRIQQGLHGLKMALVFGVMSAIPEAGILSMNTLARVAAGNLLLGTNLPTVVADVLGSDMTTLDKVQRLTDTMINTYFSLHGYSRESLMKLNSAIVNEYKGRNQVPPDYIRDSLLNLAQISNPAEAQAVLDAHISAGMGATPTERFKSAVEQSDINRAAWNIAYNTHFGEGNLYEARYGTMPGKGKKVPIEKGGPAEEVPIGMERTIPISGTRRGVEDLGIIPDVKDVSITGEGKPEEVPVGREVSIADGGEGAFTFKVPIVKAPRPAGHTKPIKPEEQSLPIYIVDMGKGEEVVNIDVLGSKGIAIPLPQPRLDTPQALLSQTMAELNKTAGTADYNAKNIEATIEALTEFSDTNSKELFKSIEEKASFDENLNKLKAIFNNVQEAERRIKEMKEEDPEPDIIDKDSGIEDIEGLRNDEPDRYTELDFERDREIDPDFLRDESGDEIPFEGEPKYQSKLEQLPPSAPLHPRVKADLIARLRKAYPFLIMNEIEANTEFYGKNIRNIIEFTNERTDTLPHESFHAAFRLINNDPLVQRGIEKFGSEEALTMYVGQYYEHRLVDPSILKDISAWLREFSARVRELFGAASKEDIAEILSAEFYRGRTIKNRGARGGLSIRRANRVAWQRYNSVPETLRETMVDVTLKSFEVFDKVADRFNRVEGFRFGEGALNILAKNGVKKEEIDFIRYVSEKEGWASEKISPEEFKFTMMQYMVPIRITHQTNLYKKYSTDAESLVEPKTVYEENVVAGGRGTFWVNVSRLSRLIENSRMKIEAEQSKGEHADASKIKELSDKINSWKKKISDYEAGSSYREYFFDIPYNIGTVHGGWEGKKNSIGWAVTDITPDGILRIQEVQMADPIKSLELGALENISPMGRVQQSAMEVSAKMRLGVSAGTESKVAQAVPKFLQSLKPYINEFFIRAMLQRAAEDGHKKVRFAGPETIRRVEGHEDIFAHQIVEAEKRLDYWKVQQKLPKEQSTMFMIDPSHLSDDYYLKAIKQEEDNIVRLREMQKNGLPIQQLYKALDNYLIKYKKGMSRFITDEHGNDWIEVDVTTRDEDPIVQFQKKNADRHFEYLYVPPALERIVQGWKDKLRDKLRVNELNAKLWAVKRQWALQSRGMSFEYQTKIRKLIRDKNFSLQAEEDMFFYTEKTGNIFVKDDTFESLEKRLSPEAKTAARQAKTEVTDNLLKIWNDAPYVKDPNKINPRDEIFETYVTHLYQGSVKEKEAANKYAGELIRRRFGTDNPLKNRRTFDTYMNAFKEKGLIPRYRKYSDILDYTSRFTIRLLSNNLYTSRIHEIEDELGMKMVAKDLPYKGFAQKYQEAKDAGWVPFYDPHLRIYVAGKKKKDGTKIWKVTDKPALVQPDLAEVSYGVFQKEAYSPTGTMWRIYDSANQFLKHLRVSFSPFHLVPLAESLVGAVAENPRNLWRWYHDGKGMMKDDALMRQYIEDGLVVESPSEVSRDLMTRQFDKLAARLDLRHTIKADKISSVVKTTAEFYNAFPHFLWDIYQPRMKVFTHTRYLTSAFKEAEKRGINLTPEMTTKIRQSVATLVNDTFGAQIFETQFLFNNPKTMQWLHRLVGYPDWTISAIRQAQSAFSSPRFEMLNKLFSEPQETAWVRGYLGRRYWAKYVVSMLIAQNLLSYLFTGLEDDLNSSIPNWNPDKAHSTFENIDTKHWLDVQLPDVTVNLPGGISFNTGRDSAGRRYYSHFGKQMLEIFRYFGTSATGGEVLDPGTFFSQMFSKSSPIFQGVIKQLAGGSPYAGGVFPAQGEYVLGEYRPWKGRTGITQIGPRVLEVMKDAMPFMMQGAMETGLHTLGFTPISKGLSLYAAGDYYLQALWNNDIDQVSRVTKVLLDNGYKVSSIKSRLTSAISYYKTQKRERLGLVQQE
uniref:Large polyvalent protein associated domain-containing protein n=1 Tax=viral metagenome TaxID=1070528 RepID=A0A6M3KL71_9ZZZZ